MYKRLNITLPEEVVARVDKFAREERYTRSGLIAAALDAYTSCSRDQATVVEEAPAAYAARTAQVPPRPGVPEMGRVSAGVRAFFSARDDVEAVWVFGSVATDTADTQSDVDLAVLPAAHLSSDDARKLQTDLIRRLPSALEVDEVDVVVVGEIGAALSHRALVRGLRVFGAHSRRAAEAEIRAMREYVDFEPVSRALDARFSERMSR